MVNQVELNYDGNSHDKQDQSVAQAFTIGRGRIAASELPSIGSIIADTTLDQAGNLTLWADNVYSLNGSISRVWALIVPPSVANLPADTPVTDDLLQSVELSLYADNRYEGAFTFSESGNYKVTIYAQDSEGLLATPE